jgi:hypothetical protein
MRIFVIGFAAALTLALSGEAGFAQAKKPAPKSTSPATETVRFLQPNDLLGEVVADIVLKETRQGAKVVSAVLDVCHSVSPDSSRKDRFVIALKPDGQKLVGAGETTEDKLAVSVTLVRKVTGNTVAYDSTITRGTSVIKASSTGNSDMSEAELRDNAASADELVSRPSDFTKVLPSSLAVRIKREKVRDVVEWLRGQKLKIDFASLIQSCDAIRSGEQVVRLETDAERASALVAKIAAVPGVIAAGWTTGSYDIATAVRFAATGWRNSGGALDRDKLASALSDALATALSAKHHSAAWDEDTGELTLKLKRPSRSVFGLDLTEIVEFTAIAGPERLSANDNFLLWIGYPSVETVDDRSGPRLSFTKSPGGGEEGGGDALIDGNEMIAVAAKKLNGRRWDADNSVWK